MADAVAEEEFLCPICMQILRDAFLTACGHSFCYMCIATHLKNKSDCPCCAQPLTPAQLFPNFLLDKLLKRVSAHQLSKFASPVEQFRQFLDQGHDVKVKELDSLLSALLEKKRKLEQQEAERNLQILLEFLHCLRKQKVAELDEVQNDLHRIKDDLCALEKDRVDLYRAQDRCTLRLKMLSDDRARKGSWASSLDKSSNSQICNAQDAQAAFPMSNLQNENEANSEVRHTGMQNEDLSCGPSSKSMSQSGFSVIQKKRIHAQFDELQEFYLQKGRQKTDKAAIPDKNNHCISNREGYSTSLADFQSVLSTVTRFSRLRVIAELRHEDIFHSANIVSSIDFDCDDELFATAGVSRLIKVFDFSSVINNTTDVHRPVVQMSTRSKLSCLSWNRFTKSIIACSDYEGIVTVWDVNKQQSTKEYEEHEKRAWSVDFSRTDPSMLVSGSDDCKVKVWCTKQEASVLSIDMKANICCVNYNPGSSEFIAVGSADHHVYYYDLRNTRHPLNMFIGHKKAVSYVKFLSNNELASASTDSSLMLWDVRESVAERTFRGHTNEKNFVGLAVTNEFLACGSETNEVFVYHKAISKPATRYRFGSPDADVDDSGSHFISTVCWKRDTPTMLAANSRGTIKVLVLAS